MKRLIRLLAMTLTLTVAGSGAVFAGPILWVSDTAGNLGTVDAATGTVNVVGAMNQIMTDIAFDPSGQLWGITFTGTYTINKSDASITFVGNHGIAGGNSLVFDSGGTLYSASTSLFTIDTTSGASNLIGNGGTAYSSSGDLAFVGGELFLSSTAGLGNSLVKLNTANGQASAVGAIGFDFVFGLASPDNAVLYGVAGTNVFTIDTLTGMAGVPVDYSGQGLATAFGSAFFSESGAVPEPGTLALLGLALAGLGFSKRRKS